MSESTIKMENMLTDTGVKDGAFQDLTPSERLGILWRYAAINQAIGMNNGVNVRQLEYVSRLLSDYLSGNAECPPRMQIDGVLY